MPRISASRNLNAFLDMIAVSEGTKGQGDDGYNLDVGGKLFQGYADHPRIYVDIPRLHIKSSAAGRYQILARVFDAYKRELMLTDFSPESQDKMAIQLIRECNALPDIEAGNFAKAVGLCKHIWASLPGAGYGQHENKLAKLQAAFTAAGGILFDAAAPTVV